MAYESTTFSPEVETMSQGEQAQQSMLERAKARGTETLEDTIDLIRRHPGRAIAIAVAVGAALGAIAANSLMEESEPQRTFNKLSAVGKDVWANVKESAEEALSSARDAVDLMLERVKL